MQPSEPDRQRVGPKPESGLYVVATPIGNLGDLSERARSVIAHADLLHSNGVTRVGEFFRTYDSFDDMVHDHLPIVAVLIEFLLGGVARWLRPEYLRRSRQHELEADRRSADRRGVAVVGPVRGHTHQLRKAAIAFCYNRLHPMGLVPVTPC